MASTREFISFKIWCYSRPNFDDLSKDYTEFSVVVMPLDHLGEINKFHVLTLGGQYQIKEQDTECKVNTWYIDPEEVEKIRSKLNIL